METVFPQNTVFFLPFQLNLRLFFCRTLHLKGSCRAGVDRLAGICYISTVKGCDEDNSIWCDAQRGA